jgi:hypothetical protein
MALRTALRNPLRKDDRVRLRFAIACAACASLLAAGAFAQGRDSRDKNNPEAQYDNESNPIRRAKILGKFAPVEVTAAADEIKNDQNDQALAVLQRLRDQVRETFQALNAMGVDPVKHSSGFRELQIGVRESIRRLDDVVFALPVDDRPPFEEVRMNLNEVETSLIDLLFPPQQKKRKGYDQSS